MTGFVYLIGNSRFHWYKIGKSKTPQIRVSDLGILLPFKITIFGIWKAQNHTLMEGALHEQYKTSRINGEWFTFSTKKIIEIYNFIPRDACIFWHNNQNNELSEFAKFSNMEADVLSSKPKIVKTEIIEIFPQRFMDNK